jgi:hypothetical protein
VEFTDTFFWWGALRGLDDVEQPTERSKGRRLQIAWRSLFNADRQLFRPNLRFWIAALSSMLSPSFAHSRWRLSKKSVSMF